jgi:hypothetical protein
MSEHVIDGRATGRQQILQMLRDVCAAGSALCEQQAIASARWPERAESAVRACALLQRGMIRSHPQLADALHLLSAEIQIALAAQSDDTIFAARIPRIREAVRYLQQTGAAF